MHSTNPPQTNITGKSKNALAAYMLALAMAQGIGRRNQSYSTGSTSKLPHDPERVRLAQEKRDRKIAKKIQINQK